ncbi:MAG TPA: 2OG-Fe(II) oxygenase [Polyangiaceae bacterium]|jgi:prolyl 4-hydroxylase|nr:2OG-Fe(II) oxygenase [Polyangiaceae bacterium]
MSSVVRFSPDLSAWLVEQLDQGQAPAALVQIMIEGRMDPRVARAIVDAFVFARQRGRPVPFDSLSIEDPPPEYVYEPPHLARKPRFVVQGRAVSVLARSEEPVVAVLGNVLSAEECAQLIELARPRLEPSTVVDLYSGANTITDHRTSLGMFFRVRENAFIAALDARISELMQLPLENGEGFQVLHYPAGAQTTPHFDFLQATNEANRASIARSGQRVSTLIAYLNDVPSGGETVFPELGLAVVPQRGNAVYFEYCNSRGQVDHATVHGGNPVLEGEKWVVTKWMRERPFVSASEAGSEGMPGARG